MFYFSVLIPNSEILNVIILKGKIYYMPSPVAERYKVWVYGYSLAEVAGSNLAKGMDVCLLWVLGVLRWRSPRRAYYSSRGVLPTVFVCVRVIGNPL